MRKSFLTVVLLTLGALIWTAQPMRAHHAFSAEYDAQLPITLKGTIAKMEWVNPHVWLYIDVKSPDGKVVQWALEFGSPNTLYKRGWRKDDLPVGAEVTIDGFRAKDGAPMANARSAVLANGKKLFGGSPETPGGAGEK